MNRLARFPGMLAVALFALAALVAPASAAAGPANLGGSPASMARQHHVAVAEAYSFLATPAEVREYAEEGRLERVTESADLVLSNVSFPYVRHEVRLFVERIAAQYRAATGDKLVVTSLTRPTTLQPANAHALSVHPAGMAVDFRIPANAKARVWLEQALLELERADVLDATRERSPAHYHVAVYPAAFRAKVEHVTKDVTLEQPLPVVANAADTVQSAPPVSASLPALAQRSAQPSPATRKDTGSPAWLLLASAAVGIGVFGARRIDRGSAA